MLFEGSAGEDEAEQVLQIPIVFLQFDREPVEQFRVGRVLALETEVLR